MCHYLRQVVEFAFEFIGGVQVSCPVSAEMMSPSLRSPQMSVLLPSEDGVQTCISSEIVSSTMHITTPANIGVFLVSRSENVHSFLRMHCFQGMYFVTAVPVLLCCLVLGAGSDADALLL